MRLTKQIRNLALLASLLIGTTAGAEVTGQQRAEAAGRIAIDVGFNDSVAEIRKYQKQLGITMPIVFDGDAALAAAFNLRVTPQHIVIGRDGRIQFVGHLADEHLDAALAAARTAPAAPTAARAADAPVIHEYQAGDVLPRQAPRTIDGQAFPLRDPKSLRPTLLVFLSPWC